MLVVGSAKIRRGKTTARRLRFVCENRHPTPNPIQNATFANIICKVYLQTCKSNTVNSNDTVREHMVPLKV